MQRLDKLEAVLAQATNDLGEAAPLLAALLSLPDRRALPAARPHPAEAKGEDACGRWWRRSKGWRRGSRC